MKKYIGTKQISAKPMSRLAYNVYRGWELPGNENGADEGYLVEYLDGGKSNDGRHNGYISWSPNEQFENAFQTSGNMTFGHAIELLKDGAKIARTGWNGSGMFVYLVDGSQFTVNRAPLNKIYPEGTEINYRPHMDIKTADGSCGTWAPSNSDTLAEDWLIVE